MLKRVLSKKIGISLNLTLTHLAVVAGAFIWYFLAFNILESFAVYSLNAPDSDIVAVLGVNCLGLVCSAIFASLFVDKFQKRSRFLSFWMLGGIFLSLLPMFLPLSSIDELISVSAVFGIYFGLGMPSAMGYFSASTNPGNRATLGGITFLVIGASFFILGIVVNQSPNMVLAGSVLAALRLASLLLFSSLSAKGESSQNLKPITYRSVASNRTFMLYFIPWIMFNVVNYLTVPAVDNIAQVVFPENTESITQISAVFEYLLIAVFAILAGFLADRKGRKRLAILGFAILGLGFGSLSFFQNIYGWCFYTIVDGIAWGILDVILLFTLWGDIGEGYRSDKLYVLGALPYVSSFFLRFLVDSSVSDLGAQIFTFASFFLFLAVLPLFYAPETLPEKIIKKNELEFYVAKAQEIAEKYY